MMKFVIIHTLFSHGQFVLSDVDKIVSPTGENVNLIFSSLQECHAQLFEYFKKGHPNFIDRTVEAQFENNPWGLVLSYTNKGISSFYTCSSIYPAEK